jgi:hypothetical protein
MTAGVGLEGIAFADSNTPRPDANSIARRSAERLAGTGRATLR